MKMTCAPLTSLYEGVFNKSFWSTFIWLLLLSLATSSCRQTFAAINETTKEISPSGGILSMPGGVSATFAPGFLTDTAAVTLTLSDVPEPYPAEIAASYRGGEAMARSATVTFPTSVVASTIDFSQQPELALRIPAVEPRLKGEERLLAEVHIYLADGQHLFFFEPYARLETDTGQNFEGTDTVKIRSGQLRADGIAVNDSIRITVRPVRLGEAQISPLALPSGFTLEDVATQLPRATAFDFASDGRIFIAHKGGEVKVVALNGRVKAFADLSGQVNNFRDRGMLGLAVHPQFPQQPYIYVLYTYDPPEVQGKSDYGGPDNGGARVGRLVRLTANASQNYEVMVPGSEMVLLGKNSTYANIGDPTARTSAKPSCGVPGNYIQDCLPADEWSHTVGGLRFSTDGSLFVSHGDGSSFIRVDEFALRAQDLDSLAGKLLRINPSTGQGYSTNPFYNGSLNSDRSKVYSYGIRNPFRFTIHPQTRVPYIGDVGWGTWEEVNSGSGKNFGWPCYEGGNGSNLQQGGYRALSRCTALYANSSTTAALYAYDHGSGGSSVQVGDFYLGTSYPEFYRGALFVSDFNQGWIRYLKFNGNGTIASVHDFSNEQGITQLSAGPSGDLYYLNIYDGKLKRVRYTASGTTPLVAKLSANPLQGSEPLPVGFSSIGSSGTGTLSYSWDFGDGGTSTEANPSHTFIRSGVYQVTLRVLDGSGASASNSIIVRVGNTPPVATILSPTSGTRYDVGGLIPFSGKGTDMEQGNLPASALSWSLKTHHNSHIHPDGLPPTTGLSGSLAVEDHGDNSYLELCLTATDSFNEQATTCVQLQPNTAEYTLDTIPTGLELPWEGALRTTPFVVKTIVGGNQQLIAPAQQGTAIFSTWSDGGAREHVIRIGSIPSRLVATYIGSITPSRYTINFNDTRIGQIISSVKRGSGIVSSSGLVSSSIEVYGQNLGQSGNTAMIVNATRRLILSSDGSSQISHSTGGNLDFNFNQFGTGKVLFHSLRFGDTTTTGGTVKVYRGSTLIKTVNIPNLGIGVSRTLALEASDATLVRVTLTGPGAIDDLSFTQ